MCVWLQCCCIATARMLQGRAHGPNGGTSHRSGMGGEKRGKHVGCERQDEPLECGKRDENMEDRRPSPFPEWERRREGRGGGEKMINQLERRGPPCPVDSCPIYSASAVSPLPSLHCHPGLQFKRRRLFQRPICTFLSQYNAQ